MPLVSKAFGDIITFTRASSATFTGSNGLIQSAAINAPRFDYDPVTLAAKGLLIEEQRTNLCTYSGAVGGTNWGTTTGGTAVTPVITLNAAVAPDGTTTASRIQCALGGGTTATDQSLVAQGLTGTSCRGSFYIKTNDASTKTIYVRGGSAANIVVTGTWQRYDFDAGTLTATQFGLGLRGGQTPTNNDTADLLVWGAQLEAGAFATSYIPTVASQVTRSADVASVNTLSPWYNATEGTLYGEWSQYSITSPNNQWIATLSDGTSNNYIGSLTNPSSYRGLVVSGGATQASIVNGAVAANTAVKSALTYKLNDFAATSGGASVVTDTSGTVPSVSQLTLGAINGANFINGHLRRITYYPRRLSNAELQAITA